MSRSKTWALWEDGKINKEETALLRKHTKDLPIPLDDEAKRDVKILVDDFLARDDALGLAAPQIGISKSMVVFKNKDFDSRSPLTNPNDYDVLINPRITQYRGDELKMSEGCLSCPEVSVDVTRFNEIKVKAYDIKGNKINKRYTGFLARIAQHEIDHLSGKLIVDHEETIYFPKERKEFFERIFKEDKI